MRGDVECLARPAPRAIVFAISASYFACGLSEREVSLLESQDFGIACDLYKKFSLSPVRTTKDFGREASGSRNPELRTGTLTFPAGR